MIALIDIGILVFIALGVERAVLRSRLKDLVTFVVVAFNIKDVCGVSLVHVSSKTLMAFWCPIWWTCLTVFSKH